MVYAQCLFHWVTWNASLMLRCFTCLVPAIRYALPITVELREMLLSWLWIWHCMQFVCKQPLARTGTFIQPELQDCYWALEPDWAGQKTIIYHHAGMHLSIWATESTWQGCRVDTGVMVVTRVTYPPTAFPGPRATKTVHVNTLTHTDMHMFNSENES